ncbi:MAG: tetratricopeptide repeat protein [Candidatus Woesearchaeota archaeon]
MANKSKTSLNSMDSMKSVEKIKEKNLIWKCLRISFLMTLCSFALYLFKTIPLSSSITITMLLSVSTSILSIIHLNIYKQKEFAFISLIMSVLILLSLISMPLLMQSKDFDSWIQKGTKLQDMSGYDAASTYRNTTSKTNSTDIDSADKLYSKGLESSAMCRYDDAVESFDEALKINSTDADIWYSKGLALIKLHRYAEAVKSLDEALKIKSTDEYIWSWRGYALNNIGRYDESLESFNEALKINSTNSNIWSSKGIVLMNLGRSSEAIASFDEALKLNPDDVGSLAYKNKILDELDRN